MSVSLHMMSPEMSVQIGQPSNDDDHLSTRGAESNESYKRPSKSQIRPSVYLNHFDLSLQSDHKVSASLARVRRPIDRSYLSDSSSLYESSIKSIAKLDRNQIKHKLSLQGVLQRLGLRSIASKRRANTLVLTGGPARPDRASPRPQISGNGLTLQSDHPAMMTSDRSLVSLVSPLAKNNKPKCLQNTTLKRPNLNLIIPTSSKDRMKIPLIAHHPQRSLRSSITETRDGKEAKTATLDLPELSMLPISLAREKVTAKVLYDFEGQNDKELMIKENEIIQIIRESSKGKTETPLAKA
jgi:hypothetical protein